MKKLFLSTEVRLLISFKPFGIAVLEFKTYTGKCPNVIVQYFGRVSRFNWGLNERNYFSRAQVSDTSPPGLKFETAALGEGETKGNAYFTYFGFTVVNIFSKTLLNFVVSRRSQMSVWGVRPLQDPCISHPDVSTAVSLGGQIAELKNITVSL